MGLFHSECLNYWCLNKMYFSSRHTVFGFESSTPFDYKEEFVYCHYACPVSSAGFYSAKI